MTRSFKIRKTFQYSHSDQALWTQIWSPLLSDHMLVLIFRSSLHGGRNSQTHGHQCFKSLKPLIWLVRFASLAVLVAFKKAIKGLLYRDGVGRTLNSLWEEKHWCPVNHHQ